MVLNGIEINDEIALNLIKKSNNAINIKKVYYIDSLGIANAYGKMS